jgi:Xaa-Pro aminopeptidase
MPGVAEHDYPGRLKRAGEEAGAAGLNAILVSPSADLVYLLRYDPPALERLTALIVRPNAGPLLLVPELERPRALDSAAADLAEIAAWRDDEDPYRALRAALGEEGSYAVSDRLWASHLLGLQGVMPRSTFVPASTVLSKLRVTKDAGELGLLEAAARIADGCIERVCSEGMEGRTEADVSRSLAGLLVQLGSDSVAFTLVASGPNGASPHHDPGDRELRAGDAVILDFGGRVGGYCSDISRTVSVGDPSEQIKEVHEVVRRGQQAAFETVRPGVRAEEVDRAAREIIAEAGYGPQFLHRTGHGIGLEEHEPPWIVAGNDEPLGAGMCFSIEPGIYLEGLFGIRIEDIVTVTDDGARSLNQASRDLIQVD